MSPSDLVRLRHMLDAAREAVVFGAGRRAAELHRDRLLTLALLKCIEIVGEAASKISRETHADHPEIPWLDIIGMRHRLIHAYFDIDFDRVSDTIAEDLPPLIASLERIVGETSE
ncbi:MAG: DUF86 domain-containing protein [Acidobacteria bacterium]|nr:DUF86 domain-containing protein [Acidobacteriota bacterium]